MRLRLTQLTIAQFMAAAGLLYAATVFVVFPFWTVDDAFITFRYATHLADHGELTWNIGETPPVEGYTGIALPVILAGARTLGLPLVGTARALGVVSFFLGWFLLFRIMRQLGIRPLVIGFVSLLYSTLPVLFTHATSGLETLLFMAAILLSLYLFLLQGGSRSFFLSLLLTSLIRPEGVLLSLCLGTAAFHDAFHSGRAAVRRFCGDALFCYFVPALAYFVWRVWYYGKLLPNTFYVKGPVGLNYEGLLELFSSVATFFFIPVCMCVIVACAVAFRRATPASTDTPVHPRLKSGCVAALAFMSVLALFLISSDLMMNYSARFSVPFFPFLWLGIALFLHAGVSRLWEHRGVKTPSHIARILLLLFCASLQLMANLFSLSAEWRFVTDLQAIHESEHYAVGKWLKEHVAQGTLLTVYIDAGAIPFISELPTVDFGRLNDAFLADRRLPLERRVDYFFEKRPGVVVFTSMDARTLRYTPEFFKRGGVATDEEAAAIIRDPRFAEFVLMGKFFSPTERIPYHQFVYLRKEIGFQ
ncbi:MAG: hypothetical protein Q7R93_01505 [bacterium]|nr:hypothetical protein [bacterium]